MTTTSWRHLYSVNWSGTYPKRTDEEVEKNRKILIRFFFTCSFFISYTWALGSCKVSCGASYTDHNQMLYLEYSALSCVSVYFNQFHAIRMNASLKPRSSSTVHPTELLYTSENRREHRVICTATKKKRYLFWP